MKKKRNTLCKAKKKKKTPLCNKATDGPLNGFLLKPSFFPKGILAAIILPCGLAHFKRNFLDIKLVVVEFTFSWVSGSCKYYKCPTENWENIAK